MQTEQDNTPKELIWADAYRPNTVADCILPDRIKKTFLDFVSKKNMPNLMLSGSSGTGKTTIARALCNDMGYESVIINASRERGIDMIRYTIKEVAGTISFEGKPKAIILDEVDGLGSEAQQALRGSIEEYPRTRFIMTCNNKNKLHKAIHSRTDNIDFKILDVEKQDMMLKFLMRIFDILKKENVAFDKKVVTQVVKKYYPDNRKILNVLQTYSASGTIDENLLSNLKGSDVEVLLHSVKEKDLRACRQWIADNVDSDIGIMMEEIYEVFSKAVVLTDDNPNNVLGMIQAIGTCNRGQYFAASQAVNLMEMVGSLIGLEYK